jgi:serine/threonine protein kinase
MVHTGTIERGSQDTYTFEEKLGTGSFGAVWKATTSNGTPVAIKVYHRADQQTINDVMTELEVLRQISTNNAACSKYAICLIDYYYSGVAPRVVMEYVEGESLLNYMKSLPLAERQGRNDILVDLIKGLDVIHKLEVTHQDLKEANIMWDAKAALPRYIDWGLACLKKHCERRHTCDHPCGTSGTAYTMPPGMMFAQFNAKNFNMAKSHDIWSLGVILLDWYTMPQDRSPSNYYGGTGSGGLNQATPYYLDEKQLLSRISRTNSALAKQVLPLLLDRSWEGRVRNWPQVMRIVNASIEVTEPARERQRIMQRQVHRRQRRFKPERLPTYVKEEPFTDPAQCRPRIYNKPWSDFELEDIVAIRGDTPGTFWCFKKEDIIADETFDPQLGSFVNPYNGKKIIVDKSTKLALVHQQLGE